MCLWRKGKVGRRYPAGIATRGAAVSVTRRAEDGIVDWVEIERAAAGHNATLTPTEARAAVWRMAMLRGVGLDEIARTFGYSRSLVALWLAEGRRNRAAAGKD